MVSGCREGTFQCHNSFGNILSLYLPKSQIAAAKARDRVLKPQCSSVSA